MIFRNSKFVPNLATLQKIDCDLSCYLTQIDRFELILVNDLGVWRRALTTNSGDSFGDAEKIIPQTPQNSTLVYFLSSTKLGGFWKSSKNKMRDLERF